MPTKPHGFTLIEILVSTAIFIIVMVIAMGSLLSISSANRKAEIVKTVMDNLNFALDSMSRSIRTGINYDCDSTSTTYPAAPTPANCPDPSTGAPSITFQAVRSSQTGCLQSDPNPCVVTYCQGDGSSCSPTGASILRDVNGGGFVPLTASEVVIDKLTFYVIGAPLGDSTQPKVTITIAGHTQFSGTAPDTEFNVQTTVTQRLYDQ